jgi:hypothetical protein
MLTLLPIAARRGEELSSALDRVRAARRLQREIDSLGQRMQHELQFNRKVGLRAEVQTRQAELDALLSST